MAAHPFRIVNVFTAHGALTGNPLCVFEDGSSFDTARMQDLARQFNLSETTFLLPSTLADARVRIFTPTYEMPFAGHPTLGSAQVCRTLKRGGDSLRLEMQAGIIDVRAQGERWTLTAPAPSWREVPEPRAVLSEALGLRESDIAERPLWVKAGKEQLIVPLVSPAAVQRCAPSPLRLRELRSQDDIGMAYVFAFKSPTTVLARFFFPQGSAVLEDPATGSATANFGGWCLALKRSLPLRLEISQGEFVGRPSLLHLEVSAAREICVGGEVREIARGELTLD